jgi:hypothetical protein
MSAIFDGKKTIMHSDMPEDDATEHRIDRRITTDWEVEWVRKSYLEAQEKERAALEAFDTLSYQFRKAANEYRSAMARTNERFAEAIESGIALPVYFNGKVDADGATHTVGTMVATLRQREEKRAQLDCAVDLAGKARF